MNTVTAADYTTETFFTNELWEDYLQLPDVQALATKDRIKHFEGLLRTNLIEMLENESYVLYECKIKIAHVTFSFGNVQIMNILSYRGQLIIAGYTQKLREIDEKISNLI